MEFYTRAEVAVKAVFHRIGESLGRSKTPSVLLEPLQVVLLR
jgi:hypothetical protein